MGKLSINGPFSVANCHYQILPAPMGPMLLHLIVSQGHFFIALALALSLALGSALPRAISEASKGEDQHRNPGSPGYTLPLFSRAFNKPNM